MAGASANSETPALTRRIVGAIDVPLLQCRTKLLLSTLSVRVTHSFAGIVDTREASLLNGTEASIPLKTPRVSVAALLRSSIQHRRPADIVALQKAARFFFVKGRTHFPIGLAPSDHTAARALQLHAVQLRPVAGANGRHAALVKDSTVFTANATNTKIAAICPDFIQVRHGFRLFVHQFVALLSEHRSLQRPIFDDLAA